MTEPDTTPTLTVWRDGDYTVWTASEAEASRARDAKWLRNIGVADIVLAAAGMVVKDS